jgi:hypothetical protein
MRVVDAANTTNARLNRESLADSWHEQALCASPAANVACGIAGVISVAAFVSLPARWACIPLALGVAGIFAIVGMLSRAELGTRTPAEIASFRRLRSIADVVAIMLALAALVSLLGLVFGGSVGVMRV